MRGRRCTLASCLMARQSPARIYKLPLAFQERHRELLDGWDWSVSPEMRLSETIAEASDLADVVLETAMSHVRRGQALVVRARTPRMAMALRQYSDALTAPESD